LNTPHNGLAWGGEREGGEIASTATVDGGTITFRDGGVDYSAGGVIKFSISNNGVVRYKVSTVNKLPICNGPAEGSLVAVSDATTAIFNARIIGGGGTNHVLAYCNGRHWTVH
jgi:hypothetical protein